MTERDFCYWLQGLFELQKPETLSTEQVTMIKNHLNLVFVHSIDSPDPTGELQAAHDGGPKLLVEQKIDLLQKKIEATEKTLANHQKFGKHGDVRMRC